MVNLRKGFTLTEILIAAGIVVFLLFVAFWALQAQLAKGRDAKRKSDLSQIKVAVEDYYNDKECYPPLSAFACNPGTGLQPYLSKVPCDPFTGESYYIELEPSACSSWYIIYTKLEYEQDPSITGVGCAGGCGPGGAYNWGVSSSNTSVGSAGGGTPPPGGSPPPGGAYYGCRSGVCTALPGPVCAPNYLDSNCFGQCGTPSNPQNECL